MAAEKFVLFFLAAVGIGLLAVIVALVGILLASIVPWKATWIPRIRKRRQAPVKRSPEPGELAGEGTAKP